MYDFSRFVPNAWTNGRRPTGWRSPVGVGETGAGVKEGRGEGVAPGKGDKAGVGGAVAVGAGAGGGVTTFLGYTRISVCRPSEGAK